MDSESKGVTAFKAWQLLPNPCSPLAHSLAPLRVSCTWGWEPRLDCLCLSLLSRRPQGHRRQLPYESPKFWLPGASAGGGAWGILRLPPQSAASQLGQEMSRFRWQSAGGREAPQRPSLSPRPLAQTRPP